MGWDQSSGRGLYADAVVGLMYTAVWNAAMLQTDDVKKAILSGLKRTKTSFEKL